MASLPRSVLRPLGQRSFCTALARRSANHPVEAGVGKELMNRYSRTITKSKSQGASQVRVPALDAPF